MPRRKLANSGKSKKATQADPSPVTIKEVESFLEQQEKSTLIQWMLDYTRQDDGWRQNLFLKVSAKRLQGINLTTFYSALENAIVIVGFIDWKNSYAYVEGIYPVLNSIRDLLEDHPHTVIELCQYAIALLEDSMGSVQDSGEVGEMVESFQKLHHEACKLAPPDLRELANYLLKTEINGDYGSLDGAVELYTDILGDTGLAHYRELAEEMWQQLPSPSPQRGEISNYKRSKVQRVLEKLAKSKNDIESVIAIKRRDLSRAHTYLEIAQLYLEDKQADRALEWAESGLKAFEHGNERLRDFAIEEYYRRGRNEELMVLAWQNFTEFISLRSYQNLKTLAERVKQWKTWRDKALEHIRQQLQLPQASSRRSTKAKPADSPRNRSAVHNRSLLVEIFLWEDEDELAWQEAQSSGCSEPIWIKLADRRQKKYPADALPIYFRQIEPLIEQKNNGSYAEAINFLIKVHDLMKRLKQQKSFDALVEQLGRTHKAKRNFIALLNKHNW